MDCCFEDMKNWIIIAFLVGFGSVHAQTDTAAIPAVIAAYDGQSIRLLGEGMGYVQGNTVHDPSIFDRKMHGQLQGDSANLLIDASIKNQRKGFFNGLGGLILTGAGIAAAANTPVGWAVVLGGAIWYGIGIQQSDKGAEQLHHAIWHHNRAILIGVR